MKSAGTNSGALRSKLGWFVFNVIALILGFILLSNHSAGAVEDNDVSTVALDSVLYTATVSIEDQFLNCGISSVALQYAFEGFNYFKENNKVNNDTLLTIIDFSKPSSEKRLYVLDVKNGKVVLNTLVAHGKNTGLFKAEHFSNTPNSLQSSLGFYITSNTYFGKHGYSLQIDGMEKGINNKARERAIVVHGAKYVSEQYVKSSGRIGRSFGCPAVSYEVSKMLIDLIKNKSCMFIYSPSDEYVAASPVLNRIAS